MAYVPADDTVMVEIRMTLHSIPVENTLYYRRTSGFGTTEMTALGEAVRDWWADGFPGLTASQLNLREIYLTDLRTATAPTVTVPVVDPITYPATDPGQPGNVNLCVSFRTAGRGRSARGRNYVTGIPETEVTANAVDTTFGESVLGLYAILTATTAGMGWTHVVVSRFTAGAPRSSALVQPVTSIVIVSPKVASQRGRLQ